MKVVLFGATGMVGQGVLLECLRDADVTCIVSVTRAASGRSDPKLREIVHGDFQDFSAISVELTGFDACFFCLGIASSGMSEEAYSKITYGIAVAAARVLVKENPAMIFIFVSGAGADPTEKGRVMWARVKGRAENAILGMGFRGAYIFRPGFIRPLDGIQSKTKLYRVLYIALSPIVPILERLMPRQVTTTRQVGRAMLAVAKNGYPKSILTNSDFAHF
jgi:uncharacterized protein YbjT (DUF2867 family)